MAERKVNLMFNGLRYLVQGMLVAGFLYGMILFFTLIVGPLVGA